MAYDNAWSIIIPAGSDPLNTADNHIRQLRLDVGQRMDDIVDDWTADPIISNTSIIKTYHWSIGVFLDSNTADNVDNSGDGKGSLLSTSSADVFWQMPLIDIPVGGTLQSVLFRSYRDDAASSIDCSLFRLDQTPSRTTLGTVSSSSTAGWHDLTIGSLAHTILVSNAYYAQIQLSPNDAAGDVQFSTMTVTYDRGFALQDL